MSCVLPTALFAVSIDLELDPLRPGRDQPRALEAATEHLVNLLGRYQIAATWAVADPAMSAATDVLLAANVGHEIAVLGDPTWVGHEAGRMRFGRELARRVNHGRAAGIPISTLALRGAELIDHLDLVVKQEISVIRSDFHELATGWFSRTVLQAPAALRFGLWEVPASMRLPGETRWKIGGGGRRRGRNNIEQAVASRSVFHLQVDALRVVERGSMAENALEQTLRQANLRQQQHVLEVVTLANVARKLAGDRTVSPARSILHPAA